MVYRPHTFNLHKSKETSHLFSQKGQAAGERPAPFKPVQRFTVYSLSTLYCITECSAVKKWLKVNKSAPVVGRFCGYRFAGF
jgi:hypothetical protein